MPSDASTAQGHSDDHHHRAKERQYWTWQTLIGISAAVISLIAVGITAAGFYVLLRTLESTREAVREAHRQADAADAQTAIARDGLIASDRPWLELTSATPVNLMVADQYISATVEFGFKNVGHSPASGVRVKPELVISDEFGEKARAVCSEVKSLSRTDGATVFPDQSATIASQVGLLMKDVLAERRARQRDYEATKKDLPDGWVALNKPSSRTDLWISGCLAYTFYGSDTIHTTGFSFVIGIAGPHGREDIDTDHPSSFGPSQITLSQITWSGFAD